MPDLRKITRAQGLVRVLPIGAAAIGWNALLIVHLDADNRMVRRHFTLLTGWGPPIPSPVTERQVRADRRAARVTSSDEVDPIDRFVFDAFFSGPLGIHHMFWDSARSVWRRVDSRSRRSTAAAQGKAHRRGTRANQPSGSRDDQSGRPARRPHG